MVQQSIVILALLNKFFYEHRENNTPVIQEKTDLVYNFSKNKIKKLNGNMNSLVGSKDIKPVGPLGPSTNIL